MSFVDKMTPKERLIAALEGAEMDRLLVSPLILNWASRVIGLKVGEFNRDAKKMADAQIACFKKYRHDVVCLFTTTSTLAEAMGTKLYFPEDDAPQVETPLIGSREDLDKLKVVEPERDGRIPIYTEALKRCVEEIGEDVFIVPVITAPFTTSAALRGTEEFIKEIYADPELVHTLMRVTTDSVKVLIDHYVKNGGVPILVEPVASGSMISEAHFREFVLPYLKECYAHLAGYELPGVLHICGRTKRVVGAMAESGAGILSLDEIDLDVAKELVGEKVCIMGNVSPADGMYKGTPGDVEQMVREGVERAADNPCGYIISTGCEVPIKTPPENVGAFMEAGRKFGALPLRFS